MGACACANIGVGKGRERYGVLGIIHQRKYIEVYNCVGSTISGSSVGVLSE